MRVLQVIHGYPMLYNAGSEVYTQMLCQGLAQRHEVHVFTREEDPFAVDFAVREEVDRDELRIKLHIINIPRSRERYRHEGSIGVSPTCWTGSSLTSFTSVTSITYQRR